MKKTREIRERLLKRTEHLLSLLVDEGPSADVVLKVSMITFHGDTEDHLLDRNEILDIVGGLELRRDDLKDLLKS